MSSSSSQVQTSEKVKTSSEQKLELIEKARKVIRGSRVLSTTELRQLYLELEHHNQFAYATEVLLIKINNEEGKGCEEALKDHQKLALYIYKDHSLPSSFKFKKALKELQK